MKSLTGYNGLLDFTLSWLQQVSAPRAACTVVTLWNMRAASGGNPRAREACVVRAASVPHFFAGAVTKSRPTTVAGRELLAAGREAKKHVDTDAFVTFFRSAAASFPSSTQSAIGVPNDLVLSAPPKPSLESPKGSRHPS